ncbi:MAG: esterase-like activity of phytase family protein, partial [Pseudomonadota bacterium]
ADPSEPGILYAVNDSFYGMQPTIFTIDANDTPARITAATRVTRNGANAQLLDLEGITSDGDGGFWLASEGRTDRLIPHALYHVTADGEIEDQIPFPAELLAVEQRFGAEGITMVGSTLWIAIQREWSDDPEGMVKLVAYDTGSKEWGAVHYPLDAGEGGWVGLSEITVHGDHAYIVERDNQIGAAAAIKKLYRVALSEMEPAPLGGELPVVTKEEVHDFVPDMTATGGYVVDKIEGFTIDAAGNTYAVTDNDGVDDSNGETLFFSIGAIGGM